MKRDDVIGKRRPTPVRKIEVPDWGECYVRKLSPSELCRASYIEKENDGQPENRFARIAVLLASDADGNRIFTDADAVELGSVPAHTMAVIAIYRAGDEFNAIDDAIESAKKNLPDARTG